MKNKGPRQNLDPRELGSQTAISGFRNEADIVSKFNNWRNDQKAKMWLQEMGYSIPQIEEVCAIKVSGNKKTDVHVRIKKAQSPNYFDEYLSVKLVSNARGYNQVDKRWVSKYAEMWAMPEEVSENLKRFTGESPPGNTENLRDKLKRRIFLDEMDQADRERIIQFFRDKKDEVVRDIFTRGETNDDPKPNWMLVVLKTQAQDRWVLKSMEDAINFFGDGDVQISKRGSLKIGRITLQRKGGNRGRETAKMLQFKINPAELLPP